MKQSKNPKETEYEYKLRLKRKKNIKKILVYYEDFFNGEITLFGISKKIKIKEWNTDFIYETLIKELNKKSRKTLKNKEKYFHIENIEKNIDIDVNDLYNKTMFPRIISPKKVIDRDDGKQEVIYESKLNKND